MCLSKPEGCQAVLRGVGQTSGEVRSDIGGRKDTDNPFQSAAHGRQGHV
jgi:hypothetical protein